MIMSANYVNVLPFFRLLLFLLLGRFTAEFIPYTIWYWPVLLMLLIFVWMLYKKAHAIGFSRRHWFGIVVSLFVFFGGLLSNPSCDDVEPEISDDLFFEARVEDVLKDDGQKQSLLVDCYGKTDEQTIHFRAIAYHKMDSASKVYLPADRLWVHTALKAFQRSGNPFTFEYADYLEERDIHCYFHLNKENHVWESSEWSFNRFFYELRMQAQYKLEQLHLNEQEYALITALLLGNKSMLDSDTKDAFSHSGAMHILAVSGLHLGVVFMLLTALFGQITPTLRGRLKVVAILSILWLYPAVTGMAPSIVRACIMFSVYLITKTRVGQYNVFYALAIAAFLILVFNPYAIIQVGFWMSFLAVTSIVYFYPYINNWFYFKKPWWQFVWSLVSVSLAAQIGTVCLSIFIFGFFPTWFLISNLLVLPVLPFVLASALFVVIFPAGSFVTILVSGVLSDLLWYMNEITQWVSQLPHAAFYGWQLNLVEMLLLYAIIIAVVVWQHMQKASYLMLTLLFVLAFVGVNLVDYAKNQSIHQFIVSKASGKSICITNSAKQCCVYVNAIPTTQDERYIITPVQKSFAHQNYQTIVCDSLLLYAVDDVNAKVVVVNGAQLSEQKIAALSSAQICVITSRTNNQTVKRLVKNVKGILVFDSSFSKRRTQWLKTELKDHQNNIYWVNEQGAFVAEL